MPPAAAEQQRIGDAAPGPARKSAEAGRRGEPYLAVHAEHVQSRGVCVGAVEELLERQQDAGLQGAVVLRQEQRVKAIQLETGLTLHLGTPKDTLFKRHGAGPTPQRLLSGLVSSERWRFKDLLFPSSLIGAGISTKLPEVRGHACSLYFCRLRAFKCECVQTWGFWKCQSSALSAVFFCGITGGGEDASKMPKDVSVRRARLCHFSSARSRST